MKWAQEVFFLPIQTLPTFWATRILILRSFIFLETCPGPIFQIPAKQLVLKMPTQCTGPIFQIPAREMGFEKAPFVRLYFFFQTPTQNGV